ncbi:hypothetical protein ACB092_03G092100 [Castanea dentata]
MDYYHIRPQPQLQTYILKLSSPKSNLNNLLSKMQGEHKVYIDAQGTARIQTTIQPQEFMGLLDQWQKRELPYEARVENYNHVMQVGELQQLGKLERLKNAEIVQSRNWKLTFNDHKDGNNNTQNGEKNNNGPSNPKHANNNGAGSSHGGGEKKSQCSCAIRDGGGGHVVKNKPQTHNINVEFPCASYGYVYPQQNYYDYHAPPPPPQNAHYVDMSCGDHEPKCIVM